MLKTPLNLAMLADPQAAQFCDMLGLADIFTPLTDGACGDAFSPPDLFANSEVGAWYDPSDLSTLFRDSVASTPLTADGQAIGLIIDKSNGLTETDIAISLTEYEGNGAVTMATVGNTITLVNALNTDVVKDSTVYTSGLSFCDFIADGSGTLIVYAGGNPLSYTLTGTPTQYRAQTGGNESPWLRFSGAAGGTTGTVQVLKAGMILGNHAYQATYAARPLYKTSGGLSWMLDDKVDDSISATVPNMGTDATVAYAEDGATVILTAQTIGAGTLTLPHTAKNYGYIAVNRALTPSETSGLTAYLDAKRGA